MKKRETYEGTFKEYLECIQDKTGVDYVNHNFLHFKECFSLGILPNRAINMV